VPGRAAPRAAAEAEPAAVAAALSEFDGAPDAPPVAEAEGES
jgi:hypothetical protein